jgi:nucleoside-diphosphate-sugar epimerase
MRYLVTGATGFVGGAVTHQLLSSGHGVRALVRSRAKAQALASAGVELHEGDITDPASLREPMRGVDGVFHLAAWYKVGVVEPLARTINVDGTRNVLAAMRECGVARGVYTSTIAINSDTHGATVDESYRFEGRHLSVYDETKAEAHRVAETFIEEGLPLTIVQPGGVYGPGDTSAIGTLFRNLLTEKLPPLPRRTAICWGYVDDVARGHVLAMTQGAIGRSYYLCGPLHTFVEAARLGAKIAGVRGPRLTLPPAALKAAAAIMPLFEGWLPLPPEFTAEGLRVLGGVTYAGTSERARRELGWRSRPLADGLVGTLRHALRELGRTPNF